MSKALILKPRLNEKTYGLAGSRVYVFDVERSANKHTVARAVESQFEVKVSNVKTTNISGKPKRVISITGKRYSNASGNRSNFKKAYVTLEKGHGLPFFEAIEEEERQEEATQEKFDKALSKQAEKEDKAAAKVAKKESKSATKAPAKAKPETEAKPAEPVAKKPESKPAPTSAASKETAPKPEVEKPEEKKHGLRAWRGFRLRKKDKGNK